jgi:hypothetical protein
MVMVEGEIQNYKDKNESFRTKIAAINVKILYAKPVLEGPIE